MDNLDENDEYFWNCEYPEDKDQAFQMSKFREPAYTNEEDCTYVTEKQIEFFLNRPNGSQMLMDVSDEFIEYEMNCVIYNILYDMSEANNNEGYLFWNEEAGGIDFYVKPKGLIHKALQKAGMELEYPDDK